MMADTITLDVSGARLRIRPLWTVVEYRHEYPDGQLGSPDFGVVEFNEEGAMVPVVLEGHGSPATAASDYQALRAQREGRQRDGERRARCAAIPAPEGALAMVHCGRWWRATLGGGCPDCGAPGNVDVPSIAVGAGRGAGVRLYATQGVLEVALEALGIAGDTRLMEPRSAVYSGVMTRDELVAALRGRGWFDAAGLTPKAGKGAKKASGGAPRKPKLKVVKGGRRG